DRPDGLPWDLDYILAHAVLYMSPELEIHGWDAFEAPLPKAMPGFNPAYPGDGLLVLVVYAESPALLATTAAHIRANLATMVPTLELFDPLGGPLDLPGVPAGVPRDVLAIEFDDFRRMSEAVLHVLECQSFAAASSSYSQTPGPGQLVLLAAPDITGIELKVKTPPNLDLPKSLLAFGMMSMADGQAVLDELLLQDRDLMDGVIPYDPPEFPPATPDPAGTSFALASCQYPGGLLDESIAYGAYGRLVERITGAPGIQPRFTVFAGDQVYVDPTAGLYDPTAQDDRYERPYHAWLRQLSVRSALRRVPSFMLLDDHEIADNWEPLGVVDAPSNADKRIRGVDAYKQYQRGMKVNYGASPVFSFEFDGFPFFMLDTRSKRDHRTVGSLSGAELFDGTTTLPALKTWLQNHNGPKFVVTPAMLLPRHRRAVQRDARLDTTNLSSLHSDGWDGYPGTLQETLGFIAKEKIEHVVFLSGDEHRGCVASVELRSGGGTLLTRAHSIHTAGTYAPFPFVNSLEEDFVSSEVIDFTYLGNNYRCVVNAVFPNPGNGATFLRARQDTANVWQLDYEFADGTVQTLAI
ncbi:MAG TPA: alkaline phosphatase D family protein, partial [Gammaproteobacteria bacterium]|nr:alkaline phosphatase D family protein [Gammaproteobacteria bacterium]